MTERIVKHSRTAPELFRTSRARADQGTREQGTGSLEWRWNLQDQVHTSPRRCAFGDWTWFK